MNYSPNAVESSGYLAFLRRPESSDPFFTVNNYILNYKKTQNKTHNKSSEYQVHPPPKIITF